LFYNIICHAWLNDNLFKSCAVKCQSLNILLQVTYNTTAARRKILAQFILNVEHAR